MKTENLIIHSLYNSLFMKFVFISVVLLANLSIHAQYQVSYIHANPLKFSMQDLNKVRVTTTYEKPIVDIYYTLLDEKKTKIFEIAFIGIQLTQGSNSISYLSGKLVWENTPYRNLLLQNQLVSGNYNLCVIVRDVSEQTPKFDDCFDVELGSEEIENSLNVRPIELQSPNNKDTIEELRPMLTWIPPSPAYVGTQFYLILTQKKDNQTCTEALNNNVPIIDKKGILNNVLNYPAEVPELIKGSKYCWRVSAYKEENEYTRSEDWEFVIEIKKESNKSIPLLNDLNGVILTMNDNLIRFGINNYHNDKNFIINISGRQIEKVLNYGYNLIELPVDDEIENVLPVECTSSSGLRITFKVQKSFEK